eukprot:gb/GECG01005165.1/.p1 GENE.gb/GECG01005165.1/~~gb/GECG01005165.1/.p1  ORF type:complete len:450 (+),score=15.72 gb/GECG01005165.1/:1-1350(+)
MSSASHRESHEAFGPDRIFAPGPARTKGNAPRDSLLRLHCSQRSQCSSGGQYSPAPDMRCSQRSQYSSRGPNMRDVFLHCHVCSHSHFRTPAELGRHLRERHPDASLPGWFLGTNQLVACQFCSRPFAAAGISKHVKACPKGQHAADPAEAEASEPSVPIEAPESNSGFSRPPPSIQTRLDSLRRGIEGDADGWREFLASHPKKGAGSKGRSSAEVSSEATYVGDGYLDKVVAAAKMVERGSLRKASQVMQSDGIASDSEEVRDKLRELHPTRRDPVPEFSGSPFVVSMFSLKSALSSAPVDGSAGISGVTYRQLQQMAALPGGAEVLRRACEIILNGECPVRDQLCAASLIALNKDGRKGVRPIAVSETLLRLAGRIVCKRQSPSLKRFFSGIQFGAGVKGGLEAVIHSCRQAFREGCGVLQIDCKNAFNCDKEISKRFPYIHVVILP